MLGVAQKSPLSNRGNANSPLSISLQIAQFFFNVFYNLNALIRHGETCNFPLWMMKLASWYNASFILLFGNFYLKSYSSSGQEDKKRKSA